MRDRNDIHVARTRDLARDLALARSRGRGDCARGLDRARHDFTDADFSGVDLIRASLTGVRWSMATTRWPSDEGQAHALLHSPDLGDGTYEFRGGTTNVPIHST